MEKQFQIGHPAYPENGSNRLKICKSDVAAKLELRFRGFSDNEAETIINRAVKGELVFARNAPWPKGDLTEVCLRA